MDQVRTPPPKPEEALAAPASKKGKKRVFLLSALLEVLQQTQFVVTASTALAVLYLRTAHSVYFVVGALLAAFTAKFLKLFIRQPRPEGANKYGKTYGMPSTHSSSIAYYGTYLSLSALTLPLHPRLTALLPFWNRLALHAESALPESAWGVLNLASQRVTRGSLALAVLVGATAVCWSRVRLGHHTPRQVIAGASLGSAVALGWMALWLGQDYLAQRASVAGIVTLPKGVATQGLRGTLEPIQFAIEKWVALVLAAGRKDGLKGVRPHLDRLVSDAEVLVKQVVGQLKGDL